MEKDQEVRVDKDVEVRLEKSQEYKSKSRCTSARALKGRLRPGLPPQHALLYEKR